MGWVGLDLTGLDGVAGMENDDHNRIDTLFNAGRLESIQSYYHQINSVPDRRLIDKHIAILAGNINTARARGDQRNTCRLQRRLKALEIFRDNGFDPEKLIRPADLPSGYSGKILLAIVSDDHGGKWVCLRSGDDWHHEILKNTIEEMTDLGFENVSVTPAGGARVQFNQQGAIIIYGTSDTYGTCDKPLAANLIAGLFPDKVIQTAD